MKQFLIVVDMQNDFVTGTLGTREAAFMVPYAAEKIRAFDGEIFVTLDTHFENYLQTAEGWALPVCHCIRETEGWQLQADIAAALAGKHWTPVEKNTFGSEKLPGLIEQAADGEPFSLEIIGLCTDICVVSNALILKARFPEAPIRVDAACCAGVTPQAHQQALGVLQSCQVEVVRTAPAFDALRVKNECVQWIRDFFEENGPGCNAVVGISGGKDSSVVAALCVEALGKDRVIGVLMPCGEQHDIDMAQLLVAHLGIRHYTVNIRDAVEGVTGSIPFELQRQSRINLPARIRMATLYAVSQSHNGRVANTCNLSEDWVGYSTRYGDSVGDFSPCSHLTVQEVKQIGRVLGLPEVLVEKVPIDGLSGLTDEDNLGFTYAELDRYIREGVIEDEQKKARIDHLHRVNLFKLQLMPAFDPGLAIQSGGKEKEL